MGAGQSAADEEHAQPVVVAVAEAAGDAAVELDEPVDCLGAAVAGAVGVEVGQERVLPLSQGSAEAGDLVAAIRRGLVSEEALVEIGSVDRAWVAGRDPEAITAFKSVGLAIQDVAAAELIVRRLLPAEA